MANLNISCKNVIESRLSSTPPITDWWWYDACFRPRYVNSNKLFHFWVNTFFIDQQRTSSLTHSSTLTAPGGPALQPAPATPPVSIGGAGPGWPPPASAEDRSVYNQEFRAQDEALNVGCFYSVFYHIGLLCFVHFKGAHKLQSLVLLSFLHCTNYNVSVLTICTKPHLQGAELPVHPQQRRHGLAAAEPPRVAAHPQLGRLPHLGPRLAGQLGGPGPCRRVEISFERQGENYFVSPSHWTISHRPSSFFAWLFVSSSRRDGNSIFFTAGDSKRSKE